MRVILLETIEKLGEVGQIVEVKPGYARNFLFPQAKAILATPAAKKEIEKKLAKLKAQEEAQKEELQKIASRLSEISLTVNVKVGEEGKLFGSVTSSDIAKLLSEEIGEKIEKSQIDLPEPIKSTGEFKISVSLGHGIRTMIKVSVIPEEEKKSTEKTKPEKKLKKT